MTAVLPQPALASTAHHHEMPGAGRTLWGRPSRWQRLLYHRWLQLPLVLWIGWLLALDRYALCRDYFFKYTDEDQAVMWYAAHDLLVNHRIAEPSFYGQDYNTCLEGILAAPLVALQVPYHVACPLVSVILGLLPFLLLAWVAWFRGHSVMAAVSLLVPLLMGHRYAMMCGIPRGFQTGIAVAMLPAVLLLPPPARRARRKPDGQEPQLARDRAPRKPLRSWPAVRYFAAAALAVVALQVGENAAILLLPVAVYAIFTTWREWKFWVFGGAGLLVAVGYPIYVYQFYYKYHPDYVIYLRGDVFHWSVAIFRDYFNNFVLSPRRGESIAMKDLVPLPITGHDAPEFLMWASLVLGGFLLIRGRRAGLAAAFAGAMITFISFGYDRVYRTTSSANTASFPFARMFLAIPVLFVWLMFLVNHKPWARIHNTPAARWLTRGALAGLLVAAIHGYQVKQKDLTKAVNAEVHAGGAVVCPAVPVEDMYAIARELQKIIATSHADLLLVGGGDTDKDIAYAMPALVDGLETMYPQWERRTWRMVEEKNAKHENILMIGMSAAGAKRAGGGNVVTFDRAGRVVDKPPVPRPPTPPGGTPLYHSYVVPVIYMVPAHGKNAYTMPELAGYLPTVLPLPLPASKQRTLQVLR